MAWSYNYPTHSVGFIDGDDLQVDWFNSWSVTETTLAPNGNVRLAVHMATSSYWVWFRWGGAYICYCEDSISCGAEKVIIYPRGYAGQSYDTVIEVPASWAGQTVKIDIGWRTVETVLNVTPAHLLQYTASAGTTVTVVRSASTNTSAALGNLPSGSLLFPGDTIQVFYSVNKNYKLTGATINNAPLGNGQIFIVESPAIIAVTAAVLDYRLSIDAGGGSAVSAYRNKSPYQGAALGQLNSGDAIYSGDVIRVSFSAATRYQITESTANGKPFSSGQNFTISGDLAIKTVASVCDYGFTMDKLDPEASRVAQIELTYNGKSAAKALETFDAFTYTDVASGSSDKISLTFGDRARLWINTWLPQKGDILTPTIVLLDWRERGKGIRYPCGNFEVDDFSFKGGPIRMTLDALAVSSYYGFKTTKRSYTWEATTIREIGTAICARNGMELFYDTTETVSIEKAVQNNEDDCSFFNALCIKYGLAVKIFSEKLVVFSEGSYESRDVICTLTEEDFETGWQWNTKMIGTYTGVTYQYANSDKNLTFTVEAGGGARILTCNEAADNLTEATRIALAALNNANKAVTTMKITVKADMKFFACGTVKIDKLGKLGGKYYIEEARHTIGRDKASKTALSLRRIETRITQAKAYSTTIEEGEQVANING